MPSFKKVVSTLLGYEDNFHDYILDPIHGQVGITKLESEVMESNVFSRLRHVKQLGFVSYIYPSATHTRYEHSIGTLSVTWEMLKRFAKNYTPRSHNVKIEGFPDDLIQATRLASLLHDLGHGPHSHAIEEAYVHLGMDIKHDSITNYLLTSGLDPDSIKTVAPFSFEILRTGRIRKLDHFRKELGEILSLQMRKEILGILDVRFKPEDAYRRVFFQLRYFLHDLLKGDIGSDRIDYLLRDTLFTGLGHRFSLSEILDNISALYDLIRERLLFSISHQGRDAVDLLLLTRYFHYQFIAHHPKNIAQTASLVSRLRKYLQKPKNSANGKKQLIRDALETDCIEEKLPPMQEFIQFSQKRLSGINYFPFKYILYRIMVDPYLREVFIGKLREQISLVVDNVSFDDLVFFFSPQSPHTPIIHLRLEKYLEGDEKKSTLIHDQSAFLLGLGRAYVGNSSFTIYNRHGTNEELKRYLDRNPNLILRKSILEDTIKCLSKKHLNDFDLLLFILMELIKRAGGKLKGVRKVIENFAGLKGLIDGYKYEFHQENLCYDPQWNRNFLYPKKVFNKLLVLDACKMFMMEITSSRSSEGIYSPSWQFSPHEISILSTKLGKIVDVRPVNTVIRKFYPKETTRFLKDAVKKTLA